MDIGAVCRRANGQFAAASCCSGAEPTKYACDVVDVNQALNNDLLEESLWSRNDIDADGYRGGDDGATRATLEIGPAGSRVRLGNYQAPKARWQRSTAVTCSAKKVRIR